MNIPNPDWAKLSEREISSARMLSKVQSIFVIVYVVSSGPGGAYMPDRELGVIA